MSLPWWLGLVVLVLLGAAAVDAQQRTAAWQRAQDRAEMAEARAATAETQLTLVVAAHASTATALAQVEAPTPSLEHALDLLLAAYKDPSDAHLRALADAFAPPALNLVRPEAEHLLAGGLHLGGSSGYHLDVLDVHLQEPDRASIQTREEWTYDERDPADQPVRCVQEQSQQIYTLRQRGSTSWLVEDVQLVTSTRRDC